MAGAGVVASGVAGATVDLATEPASSGGTTGAADFTVSVGELSACLLSVAAAFFAGGGEGVPVYSIFSQQPKNDAASSSKQPRDKITSCLDRLIPILY